MYSDRGTHWNRPRIRPRIRSWIRPQDPGPAGRQAKNPKTARTLLLALTIAGLSVANACAEQLTVDVWCDLKPLVFEGGEYPLSSESAARLMLEEARVLFSAMIYGYSFAYTPSDKSRSVAEAFTLTPLAEIAWGDPNLTVLHTRRKGSLLYGKIAYELQDYQRERRGAWSSNTLPLAAGRGEETILKGKGAKMTSFESSIKQAIRDYVRKRVHNKPRSIYGEVLLWEGPHTIVKSGEYSTASRIKLFLGGLQPYAVF